MIKILPISKARVKLGGVVEQIREKGGHVVLEKHGIPVAVIANYDDYEDYLDSIDPDLRKRLELSYRDYKGGRLILAEQVLDELHRKYPDKS
ncbi:MAG: type II toxin-antitoxin system Phd/YefM family antitoxin [Patescibacteria group bacterium]